jgi:hypothetical protein
MHIKHKPQKLLYGSRKAAKLVRCYNKKELGVFRIEVEPHGSLLRRNQISTLDDFIFLPDVIYPKHLLFVEVDWDHLKRYLVERFGEAGYRIAAGARKRAASLERLRRYLKRKGVVNIHRFFVQLALNNDVDQALRRWARNFKKESR